MNQNPYLSIAIEAARAGEEVIRHYYTSNLKISVKQDRTPVTVADIETVSVLAANNPEMHAQVSRFMQGID